jgi:arylsulfatase A
VKLGGHANMPHFCNLAEDIANKTNLAGNEKQRLADMRAMLEKYIIDGRSTPGAPQKNGVEMV